VGEPRAGNRFARVLEDLQLELRGFQDANDELGLGFAYDLVKSRVLSDTHTLDLVAYGNVAFERDANPDNFLSTMVRLRWFGSRALGANAPERAPRAETHDPSAEELTSIDPARSAALTTRLAREPSADAIRADPDFHVLAQGYLEQIERDLPPELAYDVDLHAGMESDQNFSSRQVVLGTSLAGRLVSWDPESALSRYDVFDLPGAALRWLAGQADDLSLSGQSYPTVVAGLDVVDASRDETRGAVTDDRSFLRLRMEATLRTRMLELEQEVLFLSAGWRVDQELDAPGDVRRAGTDNSNHLQLSLDLPHGWSLDYSAGRLPLDSHYDSTFALGFRFGL